MSRHHHHYHHGPRVHLRPGTLGYTVQSFFMAVVFFLIGCFMIGLFANGGGAITILVALALIGIAGLLVFLGIRSIRIMQSGGPDSGIMGPSNVINIGQPSYGQSYYGQPPQDTSAQQQQPFYYRPPPRP